MSVREHSETCTHPSQQSRFWQAIHPTNRHLEWALVQCCCRRWRWSRLHYWVASCWTEKQDTLQWKKSVWLSTPEYIICWDVTFSWKLIIVHFSGSIAWGCKHAYWGLVPIPAAIWLHHPLQVRELQHRGWLSVPNSWGLSLYGSTGEGGRKCNKGTLSFWYFALTAQLYCIIVCSLNSLHSILCTGVIIAHRPGFKVFYWICFLLNLVS